MVAGVGKEDFGDDNKRKEKDLFNFSTRAEHVLYDSTLPLAGIKERKHTKETQRKDSRKTSQRK